MRTDGRKNNQLRPLHIETHFTRYAEGSALIKMGHTHVLCTASIENSVPRWLHGSRQGWLTAEYNMLPRSTHTRTKRERGQNSGRSQEISRLIGRSLRAALDFKALGERQIYIDCDVLQADGGTRTASITGAYVALVLAIDYGKEQGFFMTSPLKSSISAVSLGLKDQEILVDLNYEEDNNIDTDMSIVMNDKSGFIEIQGTAEGKAFSSSQMQTMIENAETACKELFQVQKQAIEKSKTPL